VSYLSFKDPDAKVVRFQDEFFRLIHANYVEEFQGIITCGLYQELIDHELMIAHEIVQHPLQSKEYPLVIRPEQLAYQVLPFEWSMHMWFDCLRAFLQINLIALKYGYLLKDATPYNFSLHRGKMMLFDSSSFVRFKEGDPWNAYRQFCEEMLGPYLLIRYNGQTWSKLMMSSIRGLELSFIAKNLPLKSWFNLQALVHIHLHKNFSNQKKIAHKEVSPKKIFTKESLIKLLESLLGSFNESHLPSEGHWKDYYQAYLESDTYLPTKKAIIKNWLSNVSVDSVVDLGANVGEFSFLAAEVAEKVLSVEADPTCVDAMLHHIKNQQQTKVHPALVDLTQVSPNLGNNLQEYASLLERGTSQMVFALALVHHLAITYSFSFQQIIELFNRFSTKYLVVEFIEKSDEKVQLLLQNRGKEFPDFTIENFETCLLDKFQLIEKVQIPSSKRVLYFVSKL